MVPMDWNMHFCTKENQQHDQVRGRVPHTEHEEQEDEWAVHIGAQHLQLCWDSSTVSAVRTDRGKKGVPRTSTYLERMAGRPAAIQVHSQGTVWVLPP